MLDLYEFEVAEAATDSGGGGGEAGAVPSSDAANPQGAEGEAGSPPPAAATDTAPAWSPTDPAFRDAVAAEADAVVAARIQELQQQMQQQQTQQYGQQQGPQPLPEFDPFDPASVQAYNEARDQQLLSQVEQLFARVAQPLQAQQEAQALAEGDQRAKDMIASDISTNGEFATDPETGASPGRDLVEPLANLFVNDFAQRYGLGPRAAEAAVQKAGATIRALEKAAGVAAVNAHVNRNAQLAGASGEPGTGAGSGVQAMGVAVAGPNFTRSLALKYGQQANAIRSN